MSSPDVLDYNCFREYLKDYYNHLKKIIPHYSYRKFSSELGFSASNYLHLVITGKRNLSSNAVGKIKSHIEWGARQKKYFHYLVLVNQTKDHEEQQMHREELDKIAGRHQSMINSDQHAFFNNWYLPVLREIVTLNKFVSNLNWISKKIQPSVDEDKIKQAFTILERLKMIHKENKKWKQSEEHLKTPAEVSSEMIYNYHREMLKLSLNALDYPASERDISGMTMGVSTSQYLWIKEKLGLIREEIQEYLKSSPEDLSKVVQLNIQLFPVTKD